MKYRLSCLMLVLFDFTVITLCLALAYYTTLFCLGRSSLQPLWQFSQNYSIYLIILLMLAYEGIYSKRFDFWHESHRILKALTFSFLLVLSLEALTNSFAQYSKTLIVLTFIYLILVMPLSKYVVKHYLFSINVWKREAKIYGDDEFLKNEIFKNKYLGYVESGKDDVKTVFINSNALNTEELKLSLEQETKLAKEVLFIPIINDYNLSQSTIYEFINTRTNMIVLANSLKSKFQLFLQSLFNYTLAICLLPILLPAIAILGYLIKKESLGPIFFAHNRIGKNGRVIPTYKFRSMHVDAKERLEKLLAENDTLKQEWETNFKLKDDPRVTKIGAFLRKTSLDELPQIFNVLKGEMNFVGPRPVVQKELDMYYKEDAEYYSMVKPGITGLWQVSGRSDTDYDFRIATDKWYVRNWSLWLDIVILFKTVKVVLFREGAY